MDDLVLAAFSSHIHVIAWIIPISILLAVIHSWFLALFPHK